MNYEAKVGVSPVSDTGTTPEIGGLDINEERSGGTRLFWWLTLAIIVIGLAMAGYYTFQQIFGPEPVTEEGAPQSVTVVQPGMGTIAGTINATGSVAARREMPIGVSGEGGRVVSVPVEAGDWVGAGQVLAVIDRSVQTQQTAGQAAQVQAARADANLAQANLDRAMKLVERGFISQADIDRLTATRDSANARVRVANAQLGERRARNAQLNIVAPAAGLVLARNVEPGQVVGGGSGVLFSLARGGEMEVLANLSEDELARIATGSSAIVTPAGSDKSFTGQIWQVSPIIDQNSRQGAARIALAYAPELRPGGFASVTIDSGTLVAPMLPESAILYTGEEAYVFVVNDENTVVRRPIELGIVSNDGIAIASGLDGSEKVVLRAGGFLSEGEIVLPKILDEQG